MKGKISISAIIVAVLSIFLIASPAAAQIADGTYEITYEMKEANSDNTSIADGYFTKPALLTVKNGAQTIRLTLTGSNYIQSLSGPSGPVKVVSEDTANHVRVVEFPVSGDLSRPISMEMHIIVPDLYDQKHTARAVFHVSDLPQANTSAPAAPSDSSDETTSEASSETTTGEKTPGESKESAKTASGEEVENPKTGEDSSILLYGLLMVGSVIALFFIRKLRPARNE